MIVERGKSQQAWWILTALAVAEFFGITLWFSATAVTPALVDAFNISAAAAAVLAASDGGTVIALRLLTGTALAGLYPPGMKIAAGWFRDRHGFALAC